MIITKSVVLQYSRHSRKSETYELQARVSSIKIESVEVYCILVLADCNRSVKYDRPGDCSPDKECL